MADQAIAGYKPAPKADGPAAAASTTAAGFATTSTGSTLGRLGNVLNDGARVSSLRSLGRHLSAGATLPIQRQLIQNGAQVSRPWFATWREAISPLVDQYVGSPTNYVLRDDCALTDTVIHVLRGDRQYLLGETHGSGEWEKRIANWTVDTMQEGKNTLRESAVTGGPGGATTPTRQAQPLENTLYVTLTKAISAQALLNQRLPVGINDPDQLVADPSDKNLHTKLLCGMLRHIMTNEGPKFKDFFEGRSRDSLTTVRQQAIWDFSKRLVTELAPQISALHNALAGLLQDFSREAKILATTTIHDNRGALKEIVDEVLAITALGSDALIAEASGEKITSFSTAKAGNLVAAVRAAGPLREAAMVRNIKAARTPLLVQIGEEHLNNVAGGVGAKAIAVSKDANFEDETRRP